MIAAEAPNSSRSVVIAPPYNWSPTAALASDLLDETARAPWLTPTTLSSLATSPDPESKLARQPPPASKDSPGELSHGYLTTIRALSGALSVYESMLAQANPAYLASLDEALTATESAAWRRDGAAEGLALAKDLRDYVKDAEDKVKIITSIQVSMGGASGQVPVSIENGLHQAIEVKLNASVVNSAGLLVTADDRQLPAPSHGAARATGADQAAHQLGARGVDGHQAEPHEQERNAAAVRQPAAHAAVDAVRAGDLVPHRRGHRRSHPHLDIPRRPAVAARRYRWCPHGGRPTR